jgi:hypothetical protein
MVSKYPLITCVRLCAVNTQTPAASDHAPRQTEDRPINTSCHNPGILLDRSGNTRCTHSGSSSCTDLGMRRRTGVGNRLHNRLGRPLRSLPGNSGRPIYRGRSRMKSRTRSSRLGPAIAEQRAGRSKRRAISRMSAGHAERLHMAFQPLHIAPNTTSQSHRSSQFLLSNRVCS